MKTCNHDVFNELLEACKAALADESTSFAVAEICRKAITKAESQKIHNQGPPAWLDQALNEGKGVYKP